MRRSVSLAIKFKYGQLNLKEYTSDAALYDFVVNHEDNEDAPHPKGGRDINKLPQFTFKALRPEIKAKKIVDQFDETMEALRFVDKLRSKKLDGTFAYNRELINVSCAIFEVGQGLTDEDDNQKMQVIIQLATKSGPTFLKEIESTFNEYRLGIANAEKFEILVRSSKEAKLKIGEDTIAVKTFTKTEDKDKIDELMYLFISDPKGQENYRQMTAETELKQSQMISKGAKNKK